jgi:hypothetical protein
MTYSSLAVYYLVVGWNSILIMIPFREIEQGKTTIQTRAQISKGKDTLCLSDY